MKNILLVFAAVLAAACIASARQIRINEVSASNAVVVDEDNETSDWIELYNADSKPVNLAGYRIGDRSTVADAWRLPDTVLQPGAFLLVRASGKDRTSSGFFTVEGAAYGINSWNTWDIYRYLHRPVHGDFDLVLRVRSLQKVGLHTMAGLLLVDQPLPHNRHAGLFATARGPFVFNVRRTVGTPPSLHRESDLSTDFPHTWVRLRRTGDSVFAHASLRGDSWEFVAADRCPLDGAPGYIGIVVASYDNDIPTRATVSDLMLDGEPLPFSALTASDVGTDIPGAQWYSRELHTDFELSGDGETVYLWDGNGALTDTLRFGRMATDGSFGRFAESDSTGFFATPTPERANSAEGKSRMTSAPGFSLPGGRYQAQVAVALTAGDGNDTVRYTLDGSVPDEQALLYTGTPIVLASTATIRARAFAADALPGPVATRTFLIGEQTALPVVAVTADPEDLWGAEGIFELWYGNGEAPAHVEFWENDGEQVLDTDAGVRLHGRISRALPQKSMRLYARGRYGDKLFRHSFFPTRPFSAYNCLLLRNSGQDWNSTYLRDALFTSLVDELHFDVQAYRPCIVYLNGMYWGIENLRERVDEDFIAMRADIDPDSIDLLEEDAFPKQGSSGRYRALVDSLAAMDMQGEDAYRFLQEHLDLASFTDYIIAELFVAAGDWPQYNQHYWRKRGGADGRWRWIMTDVDMGMGWDDKPEAYWKNMLKIATSPEQDAIINPPHSTFMLRTALENPQFRTEFINRTADILNTTLHRDRILYFLDSMAAVIAPEVPRHVQRWDSSLHNWQEELDKVRHFVTNRHTALRAHYRAHFGLDGVSDVTLAVNEKGTGTVRLSTILPDSFPWKGVYFHSVPIPVTAIPAPGFRFVRWIGVDGLKDTSTVELVLSGDVTLTAVFEREGTTQEYGVVINEIMYKPADDRDSKDWVELYNSTAEAVDVGGWTLKDDKDDHAFAVPSGTLIPAGGYLVLCNDTTAFRQWHPGVTGPVVGNVDFGFGTPDDQVRLYDRTGALVDSVPYDSRAPWPVDALGSGSSIELLHPSLDNTAGGNWRASAQGGTPGRANGVNTDVSGEDVLTAVQCLPNPVAASSTMLLRYRLSGRGVVHVRVVDYLGREIPALSSTTEHGTGEHILPLATSLLAPGQYLLRLEVSGSSGYTVRTMPFVVY